MKPSAEAVLALLSDHPEGITGMDALGAGCGDRLPARIHELKAAGHRIAWAWETTPNQARIKRFRLLPTAPAPTTGRQLSAFDSPVSASEVPQLGGRAHQRAEGHASAASR